MFRALKRSLFVRFVMLILVIVFIIDRVAFWQWTPLIAIVIAVIVLALVHNVKVETIDRE